MLIGGIEAGGTKIVCGAAEVTEEGIHIRPVFPDDTAA